MKTKLSINFINLVLVILLAVSLTVNVVTIAGINYSLKNGPTPQQPASITLTGVAPADCEECSDLQQIIDALEQSTELELKESSIVAEDSAEGKALIAKYSLKRLPAVILEGDVDKLPASDQIERVGDAILVRQLPPPYYDLVTKKVGGVVDVTYLTAPSCTQCADITELGTQLGGAGVVIGEESSVVFDSVEGKALAAKYNITAVPTAIFSKDAAEYPLFVQAWTTAGTVAEDGSYVLRAVQPPYFDIAARKTRGLVKAVYLTDVSCKECFESSVYDTILESNFGLKVDSKMTVDVASDAGKKLLAQYKLTLVPAVVLTGDIDAYPSLTQSWSQIGSKESDGALVFRKVDLLQGVTYKDLSTGTVSASAAPATA